MNSNINNRKVENLFRTVFVISTTSELSKIENERLYQYIQEASCYKADRLYRNLDCSAFCRIKDCHFCLKDDTLVQMLEQESNNNNRRILRLSRKALMLNNPILTF